MQEVARQKVLAGITSEMEVAAVLGLVESKRQFTNRESQIEADDLAHQHDAVARHEAAAKG